MRWLKILFKTTTYDGQDVGRKEISFTAGGNVN
jgi:hypothetical protein